MEIVELKSVVLPALFDQPTKIGEYGATESNVEVLNDISNLMESGAVGALAGHISEIVSKLTDADPEKVAKKTNWLGRFLGNEVERQVRYQVARKALDELLLDAEVVAQRVKDTLTSIDGLIKSHGMETQRLRRLIQAGREFLDENPQVGVANLGELQFDKPRERFARKLANLATLLASHEMSVTQMMLTRAQAVDMLDRFTETSSILVPVWRQHTLALITTKGMSPSMVAEASKAHHALMRSLSQSLEGLEH